MNPLDPDLPHPDPPAADGSDDAPREPVSIDRLHAELTALRRDLPRLVEDVEDAAGTE